MSMELLCLNDRFQDLRDLRRTCKDRVKTEGLPLHQAQDEAAEALGFASWPDMMSGVWMLDANGILTGRRKGDLISIDMADVLALRVMTMRETYTLVDLRVSFLEVLDEDPARDHFRLKFWDATQNEVHHALEPMGDDLNGIRKALEMTTGRVTELASAALAVYLAEKDDSLKSVSGGPYSYASAMILFGRETKDMEILVLAREQETDFDLPLEDDYLIYGLFLCRAKHKKRDGVTFWTISSHGILPSCWVPDDRLDLALQELEDSDGIPYDLELTGGQYQIAAGRGEEIMTEVDDIADAYGFVFSYI